MNHMFRKATKTTVYRLKIIAFILLGSWAKILLQISSSIDFFALNHLSDVDKGDKFSIYLSLHKEKFAMPTCIAHCFCIFLAVLTVQKLHLYFAIIVKSWFILSFINIKGFFVTVCSLIWTFLFLIICCNLWLWKLCMLQPSTELSDTTTSDLL